MGAYVGYYYGQGTTTHKWPLGTCACAGGEEKNLISTGEWMLVKKRSVSPASPVKFMFEDHSASDSKLNVYFGTMAVTDGKCAEKCDDCQIRTINGALDYYCSRCIKDHSRYQGKCHENKCFSILSNIN